MHVCMHVLTHTLTDTDTDADTVTHTLAHTYSLSFCVFVFQGVFVFWEAPSVVALILVKPSGS